MRYADASPDDLIKDMKDIHPHIRLKAITTCARAAEYVPPAADGIKLGDTANSAENEVIIIHVWGVWGCFATFVSWWYVMLVLSFCVPRYNPVNLV